MSVNASNTQALGSTVGGLGRSDRDRRSNRSGRNVPRWLIYVVVLMSCVHAGSMIYGFSQGGVFLALAIFGALMLAGLAGIVLFGLATMPARPDDK